MKERPVIFNGEMVRAILDSRKTQTRRVMKPQPEPCYRGGHWWPSNTFKTMLHIEEQMQNGAGGWGGLAGYACPFGAVGDRMWVRETFGDCGNRLVYRADTEDGAASQVKRWVPSIHMPREACRILLEITAVRVERLNDISEEDAKAEGVKAGVSPGYEHMMHQVAFSELWQSIYGAENWSANPWVWVIEFKHVEVRDASK
ncbi:TPA: hypothetical protein ACKPX5_001574 [Serratia marcescens]|uniref:hypothetical protein n=1 Tax=Serratia nevei TaxID=2703794 RepID=UPI0038373ED5